MIGQYELERIERTVNQNRDRLHELDSLRSDVGRLEDSLQEARCVTEGLRDELRTMQYQVNEMVTQIHELVGNLNANNQTI